MSTYRGRRIAYENLKTAIQRAPAGASLNTIIDARLDSDGAQTSVTKRRVTNSQLVSEHRNRFFSAERPGEKTEAQTFIRELKKEHINFKI